MNETSCVHRDHAGEFKIDRTKRIRSNSGGLFVLILLSILILALIAVVFGWIMFLTGGFRESQNAVDAGSLNLAKQVVQNPATELSM